MISRKHAADQLTSELLDRVQLLGDVVGHDCTEQLHDLVNARAEEVVEELLDSLDPQAPASRLLAMLWPETGEPPLRWWRTALGVAVASALDLEDAPGWSRAEAAEVLGVTPRTVARLVTNGDLEKAPGRQGVTRWSVLARVASKWGPRPDGDVSPDLCDHIGHGTAVVNYVLTVLGHPQEWPSEERIREDLVDYGRDRDYVIQLDTLHLCEEYPARRVYRAACQVGSAQPS